VVPDNLREAVLSADIYDPGLNPLYRDVLAHYGVTALPCRVRDPDRKGKVESGVGHAQKTPLKGKRFESLEEAQAYLDHWEERWADKRIHGRTKRQVAGAVSLLPVRRTHRSPRWLRRSRSGLLRSASGLDRAPASCAVGRDVRAPSRSAHRRTFTRTSGPEARRTSHPRSRPSTAHTATHPSTAGAGSQGRHQHRRPLRRYPPSSGRGRNPPHYGRALASQEVWLLCLRSGLRSRTGTACARVPLRAALSGAQPASTSALAASRSSYPRTDQYRDFIQQRIHFEESKP